MKRLLFFGIVFAALHISDSQIPDFCQMPVDEGQGEGFNFLVYYDIGEDKCKPFFYKGQGGNPNRFSTERECIRNCSARAEDIYPMEASAACHFEKLSGGCNVKLVRYYYDSAHDKCKKFHWSGCFGNGNRFLDHASCNATCAGIHDDRNTIEEDEPDTPVAIICGVLLATIVASIFITVIVLSVKSKKKSSKNKAPGKSKDPQAASPLQDQGIELA